MRQHGCCSAGESDSTLPFDRLAGLCKVISPEVIEQALSDSGRTGQKTCTLSHRTMLWVVLAMGLLTHLPIRPVYKHARRMAGGRGTPSRSNLGEGRQRLGVEPVRAVFERVVRPLATPTTPGAFYKGLRLMGIDGTVLDTPDTPANVARFARSSGGRGDGAFPQLRMVSLVELGIHVEVALTIGGWQDSEQELVGRLWDELPTDALLMEDRGFFSYEHWKTLDARGVRRLVRIRGDLVLEPIRHLSDGSFEAKIYRSSYDRSRDRNGVLVRVIEYTIDDPQRTGHGDGAEWIGHAAAAQFPGCRPVLDVYHAREHLGTAAEGLYGAETEAATASFEAGKGKLLADGWVGVCQYIGDELAREDTPARRAVLDPRIGYLAAHLGRIDYRSRLADGRSIGSGLIEGQVKTLGLRRKARGARWVERHAERMAALVGLSHRTFWDTYWSLAA